MGIAYARSETAGKWQQKPKDSNILRLIIHKLECINI